MKKSQKNYIKRVSRLRNDYNIVLAVKFTLFSKYIVGISLLLDGIVLRMVNQLLKHCQYCGEKNKPELIKCGSEERKELEDLDIFALHSLQGGLW